jgi:DNA-binding IclR family transcriptional regulator
MMFTLMVESTHPLRYVIETHRWLPIYAGASGLAILAFLDDEERQEVVRETGLRPVTDRTITDATILEERVARIRQRGYAISRGERIPGAVGLAAPIFGSNQRVLGDVCVTIPEARFYETNEAWLGRRLMSCATTISSEMGVEATLGRSQSGPLDDTGRASD